jgi:transcription-repair coupling factor (superfamily II helicase)
VDIPNVNTLIVHDADKMGLSQLYQLRGRVGRSNRIAYAYFTYQRDKVLTEVAEKRLQSIKEFTELGSGFKIAMRDLSIRGAGNLLGAEQHGFIASVGFDLYSQMLAEEINKRKVSVLGEEDLSNRNWSTSIDVGVDAYLPGDYIYDSIQKIEIYKKVAAVSTFDEAMELEDELVDRFGDLPEAVLHLLAVARLKVYGRMYGIESIAQRDDNVVLKFHEGRQQAVQTAKLGEIGNRFERRVQFEQGTPMSARIKGKGLDDPQLLELLEQFLSALKEAFTLKEELQNVTTK